MLAPAVAALSIGTSFAAQAQQAPRAQAPLTPYNDVLTEDIGVRLSFAWETMSPQRMDRMYKDCRIRSGTALELTQGEITHYYPGSVSCIFDKLMPVAVDQIYDQIQTIRRDANPDPRAAQDIRTLQRTARAMQGMMPPTGRSGLR